MTHAQKPVRTVAPTETPVSVGEVKEHLRVDTDDEDTLIEAYLDAAVSHLDGWGGILGRCMVTQTWRLDLSRFGGRIRLPFPDAQSVTIAYTDPDGAEQTFTDFHLITDALGSAVVLASGASWPSTADMPNAARVTGVFGYGAASAVPWAIKAAIMLHVGTLYENCETLSERVTPNMAFEALIAPHRMVGI